MEAQTARQTRPEPAPPERWGKSWTNRQLGGVCGGIAERAGINPWTVRVIFILACFVSAGAAILIYLALYFTLPWNEEDRIFPPGPSIPTLFR